MEKLLMTLKRKAYFRMFVLWSCCSALSGFLGRLAASRPFPYAQRAATMLATAAQGVGLRWNDKTRRKFLILEQQQQQRTISGRFFNNPCVRLKNRIAA
ncbi:MAG: hypothetical protein JJT82_10455 [Legionellaceae bacterium]|nr:hypothetical protein [Legionellaceae bacterium]